MGSSSSKRRKAKQTSRSEFDNKKRTPKLEDFGVLASQTPFSETEVKSLLELFNKLSNSVVQDGYVQKEELQLALFQSSQKRNLFLDRMFDLFDIKQNGHIEFEEFVRALAVFHPKAPRAEKIAYAFRMYDLRGTGFIEKEELKEMVMAIMDESELHLSNSAVEAIVDQTYQEADSKGDGRIDMEEWKGYVEKYPNLLKNMTLPYLMDITLSFPSFKIRSNPEASSKEGDG